MEMVNTVNNGDCLELMKLIPDGSVDMILCDLPYGTTACKWDVIIPFEPLWEQYERIIKKNGAIVLTSQQPFTTDLIVSNRKLFKYTLIWEKNRYGCFMQAKRMPMRNHEDVLIFYNKPPTYNPQRRLIQKGGSGGHNKEKTNIFKIKGAASENYKRPVSNDGLGMPGSIIKINSEAKPSHPTEKPVELFEWLIKTYTNEGETVLDNCAGSGTTAIACLNTNRNYILMEKEQEYFDKINTRIEKWHSEREPKGLFKQAI